MQRKKPNSKEAKASWKKAFRKSGGHADRNMYATWYRRLFVEHLYALGTALARLSRTPVATLMTVAIIGVALALPAGMLLLSDKAQGLLDKWNHGTQVSVFLEQGISQHEVSSIMQFLDEDRRVATVKYIPADEVLEVFRAATGMGDWVNKLDDNPLPSMIEITPALRLYKLAAIEQLVKELSAYPHVDIAQLDVEWVNRLQGIIEVIRQAARLLMTVICIGVLLVIANTIRLVQELYRDELEIMNLVGATHRFVRRPFFYAGIFYGAMGGIIAWLLLDTFTLWLSGPIMSVVQLYQADVTMQELGVKSLLMLVGAGAGLGAFGALSSVFFFLRKQEREMMI